MLDAHAATRSPPRRVSLNPPPTLNIGRRLDGTVRRVQTDITDEYMKRMLGTVKPYTLVVLRTTPKRAEPGSDAIIWEHGRRLFQLRRDGKMCIVGPSADRGEIAGIGIFVTGVDETREIMEGDPAVRAGVLTYDIHTIVGYPGDALAR